MILIPVNFQKTKSDPDALQLLFAEGRQVAAIGEAEDVPTKKLEVEEKERETVGLCLGFFDGLHLGHQKLLETLCKRTKQLGCKACVYTFDALPKNVSGRLLQSSAEKTRLLAAQGIDRCYCQHFDPAFASLSAREFLDLLNRSFELKLLVVGYDFRFGHDLEGTGTFLQNWGAEKGVEVAVVPPVAWGEQIIHSSWVRKCLEQGDWKAVEAGLGRFYSITEQVQKGRQLGRKLGFPTANFHLSPERVYPPVGVYRSWTRVGLTLYPSLTSLGYRPSIREGEKNLKMETHLQDFSGDLYGKEVQVFLVEPIRAEQIFENLDALQNQMQKDLEFAEQRRKGYAVQNKEEEKCIFM